MTPEEFVISLNRLILPVGEYRKMGMSEVFIQKYICYLTANRRTVSLDFPGDDELCHLIREWDVSDLQVGAVHFLKAPSIVENRDIVVGAVESDTLVIDGISGEIEVRDGFQLSHKMWVAGKNGGYFLDALAHAAVFLEKRGNGQEGFDHTEAAREAVNTCTIKSGGEKYRDFYVMMLS